MIGNKEVNIAVFNEAAIFGRSLRSSVSEEHITGSLICGVMSRLSTEEVGGLMNHRFGHITRERLNRF